MQNNKILIFAGAFNPPHIAHLKILLNVTNKIKPNKIMICVDKIPPWKNIGEVVPFFYRKQMVQNLFNKHLKFSFYNNKKNYIYSCDIIKDLKNIFPHDQLFFLIGQDQYSLIKKWKNYSLIDKLTTIICWKRSSKKINPISKKHLIINDEIYNCCSTKLRLKPNIKQLGAINYHYIKNNKLYLQYQIKNYMSDKRYQHTLRVLDTISQIAISNHFNDEDIWRCQIAAILHDIAKEIPISKLKHLISNQEFATFPSAHCAHGLAGAKIAKQVFEINDLKILDAINNHVIFEKTGFKNNIAKALFCADKLEPARTEKDIPNRSTLFDNCQKNLSKTFLMVLKLNKEKY